MTTTFPPGAPNWLDLGTTDVDGARDFYGEIFGWTLVDLGPEAGGYGFFLKDGKQVAGIGPATDADRGTSWSTYFATDDVDAVAARVETHGGKVIVPPEDVMDQGRMAVFTDPAGAFFSSWQPAAHHGAELVAAVGAMAWVELSTTDAAAAAAFYPAVLPASARDIEMGPGMTYTLLNVDDHAVAGIMQVESEAPRWGVYFDVADCDAVADRAISLGATEMLREDSPAGRMATLVDPQGGIFSIIKSNPDFAP
ncbi:putative enzyme related to lactoylglutathione lyase [Allocatelliglobosispora scoriae]|uniref:Putative enzyme related to lactoylglutathione lyase n=1 Tax=Allocatelliglobosispora scoriae TaxID=643052 RepID=A0A841BRG2_9ACTN|nr:VOC family protein [Allocatelliglobosispora scoriae]MBB5869988.1 putative enzyme related to lactoylglutathione lyase [Allocatelliglobosispora scoriae]